MTRENIGTIFAARSDGTGSGATDTRRGTPDAAGLPGIALGLLEHFPLAIALVDGAARLLHANEAARRIAAAGDGLVVADGAVVAGRENDTASLHELIRDTAGDIVRGAARRDRIISLARRGAELPLHLRIRPAGYGSAARGALPAVALYISDPEDPPDAAPDVLRQLFRLTAAEAGFLAAFLRHAEIAGTARALGISATTARSHLRSLFRKTGTRSQAALVRRVTASPVWNHTPIVAGPDPDDGAA
jgi:DNA-binding CsgD family transcriptional regulator